MCDSTICIVSLVLVAILTLGFLPFVIFFVLKHDQYILNLENRLVRAFERIKALEQHANKPEEVPPYSET